MTLSGITCRRPRCLALTWNSALTDSQVTVHEIVAILLSVQIIESQLMTHLMLDRCEQIDVARRRARRIGIASRRGDNVTKAQIGRWPVVDKPTLTLCFAVNQDMTAFCISEIGSLQSCN